MDLWTLGWLIWLAAFLALEVPALASRTPGASLSEHVWHWFRVLDRRPTKTTWVLRGLLLAFLGWLFLHLGFGWLTT